MGSHTFRRRLNCSFLPPVKGENNGTTSECLQNQSCRFLKAKRHHSISNPQTLLNVEFSLLFAFLVSM